jgi:hypothetical protein
MRQPKAEEAALRHHSKSAEVGARLDWVQVVQYNIAVAYICDPACTVSAPSGPKRQFTDARPRSARCLVDIGGQRE